MKRSRAIEHAVIPWCRRHDVAVVAYSPFGSGRFPSSSSDGGRALASIGEEHGATPRQVALAFLLREPGTFVIPKTSSVAHLHENLGAAELRLSEQEVARLDDAFPRGSRGHGLPMI
jgi:diketogulonate reductase-like aldo/keto reductase